MIAIKPFELDGRNDAKKYAIRVSDDSLFARIRVSRTTSGVTCCVDFEKPCRQLAVLLEADLQTLDSALFFTDRCESTTIVLHGKKADTLRFEFVSTTTLQWSLDLERG